MKKSQATLPVLSLMVGILLSACGEDAQRQASQQNTRPLDMLGSATVAEGQNLICDKVTGVCEQGILKNAEVGSAVEAARIPASAADPAPAANSVERAKNPAAAEI